MSINIIGAGLAGLSAAVTLAKAGVGCNLISAQESERAQSVMAEGGINACLNTMGEDDRVEYHIGDTIRGGVYLADPNAVKGLCENAPGVVESLARLGVPFAYNEKGIVQRNFGGQKKKRTAFVKSSTGKMLMTALIDEARRHERSGLITRYPHHRLTALNIKNNRCFGACVADIYSGKSMNLGGAVILACGGMNGLFEGLTTGTTQNTADAAAICLESGVQLANLEMIQYHPTTIAIPGKRLLISEAARGEGGRLFVMKDSRPWYFMEEKYPELKNLMPRDVVSAEIVEVTSRSDCGNQVYLDMTGISAEVWNSRLSDLRDQCVHYLNIDPVEKPVPVSPGIHYFMGGIRVDERHRTSVENLFAAGECACQYHGANRLGGNSLLGAVYGGSVAAESVLAQSDETEAGFDGKAVYEEVSPAFRAQVREALAGCMKILRNESGLLDGREKLSNLESKTKNGAEARLLRLAGAAVDSALLRRESRGAHKRTDFPETLGEARQTVAEYSGGKVEISLQRVVELWK